MWDAGRAGGWSKILTNDDDFSYYVACYFYDPTNKADRIMFSEECSDMTVRWPSIKVQAEEHPIELKKGKELAPPPFLPELKEVK